MCLVLAMPGCLSCEDHIQTSFLTHTPGVTFARRNGYLKTYYGTRGTLVRGMTLAIEGGEELQQLQIRLIPFGVIGGTVRDQDGKRLT
jgi:hypothetical protein